MQLFLPSCPLSVFHSFWPYSSAPPRAFRLLPYSLTLLGFHLDGGLFIVASSLELSHEAVPLNFALE